MLSKYQDKEFLELLTKVDHPFYCYDLLGLSQHLKDVKNSCPDFVELFYATKANPLSVILNELREHGFGIDVASEGELQQANLCQFSMDRVIATGPAKSKEYLERLVSSGVSTIVLESLNQLDWVNQVAVNLNKKINVLLRCQIDWSDFLSSPNVLGGHEVSAFGIDCLQWESISKNNYKGVNIIGTHIFQWGNILELDHLRDIWEKCIRISIDLADKLGFKLELVDLGGGVGIPYDFETPCLKPSDVFNQFPMDLIKKYDLKIWLELGRYLVGRFGSYFTKVIDQKKVFQKDILVLEGGINHIARTALTQESFPAAPVVKDMRQNSSSYQIHGPLCTSLDKFGEYSFSHDLSIGDWIGFHHCGAYGFTESMPFFLGHSMPAEVVYDGSFKIHRYPKSAHHWMV